MTYTDGLMNMGESANTWCGYDLNTTTAADMVTAATTGYIQIQRPGPIPDEPYTLTYELNTYPYPRFIPDYSSTIISTTSDDDWRDFLDSLQPLYQPPASHPEPEPEPCSEEELVEFIRGGA